MVEEDCLELVEVEQVEEASWVDLEARLSLRIPTRIHSEPQRAPALSLETQRHRKAAAYLVELPARLLVALEDRLLSPPSLGLGQVWRSGDQGRGIFQSQICKIIRRRILLWRKCGIFWVRCPATNFTN